MPDVVCLESEEDIALLLDHLKKHCEQEFKRIEGQLEQFRKEARLSNLNQPQQWKKTCE